MPALHESREKTQSKNPFDGKKLMGKNLNENWHISTILKRVCFVLQHRSKFSLFFGKEQYMCWGGKTVVQADLYKYLPTVKVTA